jgi:prepilin-type N-terminal cleavage/methylation domain-containing protein
MNDRANSAGFSFVELVIAIALLGIISVTVSARWFSTDSFQADSLKSQLIAEARLAQRTALANSQLEISLVISEVGDEWRYQTFENDGSGRVLLREVSTDSNKVTIQVIAGSTQMLGTGVSLDISYDGLGSVGDFSIGGVADDASNGVLLLLMGGSHQLCISPLGYAHDGNCV